MKKLLFSLALLSIVIITSCGDDEETPPVGVGGTITFDGQSYTIASGVLTQSAITGATQVEFFLADGTVSSSGSSSDSQIIIGIRAISEGTDTLEAGTYEVSRQVTTKYAFVTVSTATVSNLQSFAEGTIAVSGSGNTYNLTFNNVSFGSGITLTGSVSGTFGN